jgi:hypothetical protein
LCCQGAYLMKYSSSRHNLNAQWATPDTFWLRIEQHLGASMMSPEQQKIRQTGNHPIRFIYPWINQ